MRIVKQQVIGRGKTRKYALVMLNIFAQIFPGMFAQSQVTCNDCNGRGTTIKNKCPHCGGNKVVDHVALYTLEVTPGMPEGYEVVFEGESDESPDWDAGDVVIRVRSRKDNGGWRRKESSLYWKETIGVDEVRSFLESTIFLYAN
jgi:DnaJ-related protein SCJ1